MNEQQLRAEIERLQQHVHDLQSGMYVNCVYCGHRYGPADKVAPTMAEALKRHIATCGEHPMSRLVKCCNAAGHVLCSLLAVREGIGDDVLRNLRDEIRAAVADSGAPVRF